MLYAVWCCSGRRPDGDTREELKSMFPRTTVAGVPTEEVFQDKGGGEGGGGRSKWFLRVDYCSAKDSDVGHSIVETVDDVVNRLYTSMRAVRGLADILEESATEKPRLFPMPFNAAMNPARECRVFCPHGKGRISAISQYRWTEPFRFQNTDNAVEEALAIYRGACAIYDQIMERIGKMADVSTLGKMQQKGFTFDVLKTPSGEVQFVEINPFGAMNGCGSCLFHWIRDAKLLYGMEQQVRLQFAV